MTREEAIKEVYGIPVNKKQHEALQVLIPELKESEDEKIRKAILEFFKLQDDNTTYCFIPKKSIIAWLEKQKEQKPAEWSEEDEAHLKWLCRIIRSFRLHGELSLKEESELGKWIDKWINHEPQQENKWSEFDEDCLKRAIWYVENPAPSVVKDTNLVLWLKSLRLQPHWKPSEEQMIALKCAIEDIAKFSKRGGRQVEFENEPYYMALHSLYEQLKKLM